MTTIRTGLLAFALLACLPAHAAQAADTPGGIGAEIRRELADARQEVRIDLAKAKRELETENLRIDEGVHFGRDDAKATRGKAALPRAEITPQGDLLIAGKAQPVDAGQRRQLLAYRGQVIAIARDGIDIRERSAEAALAAIGNGSVSSLLFGAMTGSLERRVERVVRQQVEPAVRGMCRRLPALLDSQQRLAASLPQFRPYATLDADDVADCEADVRNEFASR
jgi:hypothetical protein